MIILYIVVLLITHNTILYFKMMYGIDNNHSYNGYNNNGYNNNGYNNNGYNNNGTRNNGYNNGYNNNYNNNGYNNNGTRNNGYNSNYNNKNEKSLSLVYELRLGNHKFYIGFTKNLNGRLATIIDEDVSAPKWTKKHSYDELISVSIGGEIEMRKIFIEYAQNHGIENVRCTGFTNDFFEPNEIPDWIKEKDFDLSLVLNQRATNESFQSINEIIESHTNTTKELTSDKPPSDDIIEKLISSLDKSTLERIVKAISD